MYAGSKYESHYTVWTAWISIRVRVRVRVYFILQNLTPPGTTVHVPTASIFLSLNPSSFGVVPNNLASHAHVIPPSHIDCISAFQDANTIKL